VGEGVIALRKVGLSSQAISVAFETKPINQRQLLCF
jgi:hypothetical protein